MSTVTKNLDDFFKKRDKKKNTKAKFSTLNTEEFAKQLEAVAKVESNYEASYPGDEDINPNSVMQIIEPSTNVVELTVSSSTTNNQSINLSSTKITAPQIKTENILNTDEDWKPFESEENKDYSGLRVNLLQNWKDDNDEENEYEIDGESDKKPNCPWKKIGSVEKPIDLKENVSDLNGDKKPLETEKKMEITSSEPSTTAVPGKYIPPSMRNTSSAISAPVSSEPLVSTNKYVPPSLRAATVSTTDKNIGFQSVSQSKRNKNQPNINDICEFPSLSDAPTSIAEQVDSKTSHSISASNYDVENDKEVTSKPATSHYINQENKNLINLGNKFDALSS